MVAIYAIKLNKFESVFLIFEINKDFEIGNRQAKGLKF